MPQSPRNCIPRVGFSEFSAAPPGQMGIKKVNEVEDTPSAIVVEVSKAEVDLLRAQAPPDTSQSTFGRKPAGCGVCVSGVCVGGKGGRTRQRTHDRHEVLYRAGHAVQSGFELDPIDRAVRVGVDLRGGTVNLLASPPHPPHVSGCFNREGERICAGRFGSTADG